MIRLERAVHGPVERAHGDPCSAEPLTAGGLRHVGDRGGQPVVLAGRTEGRTDPGGERLRLFKDDWHGLPSRGAVKAALIL